MTRHQKLRRPMPLGRPVAVTLVIALTVLGSSCSAEKDPADDAGPSSRSPSSPSSSPPTSPSASSSVDPASVPSIKGRYAVDGDRKLALVCWGEGSPTVLLETGGVNIDEWTGSAVVSALAGSNRVCTYDRAGTGRSDPAPKERRDAEDVVSEAHTLLKAADLTGPLVLVGRSFGGMVVAHYAEALPDDVVGVVILDTPAPSAEFTPKSEPELVWDFPGNIEHLDVVGGFENRFANDPPRFDAPLLIVTPTDGEGSAENESFWLPSSPHSRQVTCAGEPDAPGPCADAIAAFVQRRSDEIATR